MNSSRKPQPQKLIPKNSVDFVSLCRRISSRYYLAQGISILLWWLVIFACPESQSLFFPAHSPSWLIISFALPDMLLAGIGSLVTAYAIRKDISISTHLAWTVTGCLKYATLVCISWSFTGDSASLSTGLMIPCCLLSVHSAILSSRTPFSIFVTFRGSRRLAALETAFQVAVFWSLFLYVLPGLFLSAQQEMGWSQYAFPGQASISILLFVVFGTFGLWSSVTMIQHGQGTPLPMREAKHLVCSGPYALVRNPMAIAGVGQGIAVAIGQGAVLYIAVCALGAFIWHVTVRPVEEAHLLSTFGSEYEEYRKKIRCWWISFH